jgi:uncharacterized repeat protein (TIGR01451 family)
MNVSYGWRVASLALELAVTAFLVTLICGGSVERSVSAASALPLIQVPGTADLTVSKTDSPDPVVAGNDITYTINFSNAGPDSATSVQVQDTVPTGTTFVSASVTSGIGWTIVSPPVGGTGAVTFTKAMVANAETATFSIVVRASTASSSISNTVTVSGAEMDPMPGNSSATAVTGVALFDLCIRDDVTRALLSINTTTKTFQFSDCGKGTLLSGTGTVTIDPSMCKIFFSSQSAKSGSGSGATATLNMCTMVGTAQVFKPGSTTPIKLNDSNIANNVCSCL